jgi:hypothetical protein
MHKNRKKWDRISKYINPITKHVKNRNSAARTGSTRSPARFLCDFFLRESAMIHPVGFQALQIYADIVLSMGYWGILA